jgi:hypothetical protein
MKKVHIICMILMSALALVSCASSSPSQVSEKLFSEMYSDCSMNEALRLSLAEPLYSGDKDLNLQLEVVSDASIIFPADYNLLVLSFDSSQNKWIKRENNIQYLPLDAKYIFGKNNPEVEYDYDLIPIAPSITAKTSLRVVVHGNTYENGIETEKCTGAFVDITATP